MAKRTKKPEPEDLSTEILRQIRDEMRTLRTELTGAIGETNQRLGRLETRQTETEMRLATEIVAVAGIMQEIRALLREQHGKQLADLTGRVVLLEQWQKKASGQ